MPDEPSGGFQALLMYLRFSVGKAAEENSGGLEVRRHVNLGYGDPLNAGIFDLRAYQVGDNVTN
jgi:hypothetical protein